MMRRVQYEYNITTIGWRRSDDVHAALGPEYWEQYDDDDDDYDVLPQVIPEMNWEGRCFGTGSEGKTIRQPNEWNCASARAAREAIDWFEAV